MDKIKRRYQILLHRCLVGNQISQEMFSVLTQLTNDEINLWFSNKVPEVRLIVYTLGMIVEYQTAKQVGNVSKMYSLRQVLGQDLSLWSDSVGFESLSYKLNSVELGLLVLKLRDHRQAVIWALRLKVSLPEESMFVRSPYRLRNLILRISNWCMSPMNS
ncbi:hypothetical protein AL538_00360 [Vibrio harveyi]|uniref:Uncharacterized protein n=1 Tax=Vibrio harveyi TaxID=669 RepID=A0ABN4KT69_VIBHA|nr:hypothetical protein AL538_00360 [Vibrio harveyi]